ncbi:hypothetical protein [Pragia fontium]|uniref:hypothetical protein n=1 Tax=Pragia fontium TaxID=82985 RepID=UPI000F6FB43B|nr:hypothetical protein [Pragia fontium]VEJ53563.1 Uncharacterised protein [Pragia fontium]
MPQIKLTYTPNLPAQDKLESFVLQLHQAVSPIISSDVSSFKPIFNQLKDRLSV